MQWITDPQSWIAFATLTVLELVLGIDNVVFISILSTKLPREQQERARRIGLGLAMLMRIGLLFSLSYIMRWTEPLFSAVGQSISGRDIVLIVGGLFLMGKSTHEIHANLEGEEGRTSTRVKPSLRSVLIQIILLDLVFSLDSVITAVGMVEQVGIMVAAVMLSVGVMMAFAGPISNFVERHPTVKMLALSFLLMIGLALVADGLDQHIPKGYLYFAMAFSVGVELLNLRVKRKRGDVIRLRHSYVEDKPA